MSGLDRLPKGDRNRHSLSRSLLAVSEDEFAHVMEDYEQSKHKTCRLVPSPRS